MSDLSVLLLLEDDFRHVILLVEHPLFSRFQRQLLHNSSTDNNNQKPPAVQEIARRIADITADSRETTFLFQRLSMALQRGNAVSFLGTSPSAVAVIYTLLSFPPSGI